MRNKQTLSETSLYHSYEEALEQGDLNTAMAIAKGMVAEYPKYPIAHYSLASIFEELQEWADAVLAYQKVLEVDKQVWSDPVDSDVPMSASFAVECASVLQVSKLGLGHCYEMMGMREQAIKVYESFLAECPEHKGAQEAIIRLQNK